MIANVTELLQAFKYWAASQSDIVAVALVGSYARGEATVDSDVDVMILTHVVEQYLLDSSWASAFGEVVGFQEESYGRVTSLRVFYKDGIEVEYGFSTPEWANLPMDHGTLRVVRDGIKALYDPQSIILNMQSELGSSME